ncbi:MAG: nucleotide pyrophosphohydrolase, partial [Candidatus Thorarchaeota archaeon]
MSEREYSLEDIRQIVRKFVEERDWQGFQKPSALAVSIAIEIGELLEMFQWLTDEEISDLLEEQDYRTKLADEIADVIIYLLRLSDVAGINPTQALLRKMEKNRKKYPLEDWKGKIP